MKHSEPGLRDFLLQLRYRIGLLPGSTMTDGVAVGTRFCAGPSNPAYASGSNELPVQRAVDDLLRPGMVFFDIGANVGFFAVIAAKRVAPAGRVIAFEPVPGNAAFVRLNCRINGIRNVDVIERAVGQSTGTGKLLLAKYSGGAALEEAGMPPDYAGAREIEVISLDDWIGQGRLPVPSVIKLDVEGAEIHALRGMRHTLQTHKPAVVFEVDSENEAGVAAKWAECSQFLREINYDVRELEDSYPRIKWRVRHGVATAR